MGPWGVSHPQILEQQAYGAEAARPGEITVWDDTLDLYAGEIGQWSFLDLNFLISRANNTVESAIPTPGCGYSFSTVGRSCSFAPPVRSSNTRM